MLEYAYVTEVYGQSFIKGNHKEHGLKHKTARKSGEKEQDDFSRKRNFDMSVTGAAPDSKLAIAATPSDARGGPSPVLSPYPGSEASIYDEPNRLIPPMYEVRPMGYALNGAHGPRFGTPRSWQTPAVDPLVACQYSCPTCGMCACSSARPKRTRRGRTDFEDLIHKILTTVALGAFAIFIIDTLIKRRQ